MWAVRQKQSVPFPLLDNLNDSVGNCLKFIQKRLMKAIRAKLLKCDNKDEVISSNVNNECIAFIF